MVVSLPRDTLYNVLLWIPDFIVDLKENSSKKLNKSYNFTVRVFLMVNYKD